MTRRLTNAFAPKRAAPLSLALICRYSSDNQVVASGRKKSADPESRIDA
jgi:hypothetical protein